MGSNRKISIRRKERLSERAAFLLLKGDLRVKHDKAIEIIVRAAGNYRNYLQNKNFLIIYQEKQEVRTTQVECKDNHFLHLTGVKSKLSAQRFYEKCLSWKLSPTEIELDKSRKTQQKLMVLPF